MEIQSGLCQAWAETPKTYFLRTTLFLVAASHGLTNCGFQLEGGEICPVKATNHNSDNLRLEEILIPSIQVIKMCLISACGQNFHFF